MSAGKSVVSLWNLAIHSVGTRGRVAAENERSREAEICREWYPQVRDQVLSAAHWSSVRGVYQLPLLAERDLVLDWQPTDPEPPWIYAYGLPNDFLYPRHLDQFSTFQMTTYNNNRALVSNQPNAILLYTKRDVNVSVWEHGLYMAVMYALAAAIAEPMHGKAQRGAKAAAQANDMLMAARVNSANESQNTFDSVPDWFTARGVGLTQIYSQYIYPYGPLLTRTAVS